MTRRHWVWPDSASDELAKKLAKDLELPFLVAQILLRRNLSTTEEAFQFLHASLGDLPDPRQMDGMQQAIERLVVALAGKEKVTLFGDYDVDGVTSTAMLKLFLEELGGQAGTYIPHRLNEGYGLNIPAIERIARQGTRLLVTLDCGISAYDEILHARKLGMDVIVVDHHAVPQALPQANAILNPLKPTCRYPDKNLCAAGLTFALCMALRKHLRERGWFSNGGREPNLKSFLDLAALGTVADVVPLRGVNRILVRYGLEELSHSKRQGICALKEVSALGGKPLTAGRVGFQLAPRINAAGRLDDAGLGVRLLCTRDASEAQKLARKMDAANDERRAIERRVEEEATLLAEVKVASRRKGLVLAKEGWHAGVIGIVASRLVERFHRPVVMVALNDGIGKGSARSIEGLHLFETLSRCAECFERFGGHHHAAGLTIQEPCLQAFEAKFEALAEEGLSEEALIPRCHIDAGVVVEQLNEGLVEAIQKLAPFGCGNPEPVLAVTNIRAAPSILDDKQTKKAAHLKLRIWDAPHIDVIGFNMAKDMSLKEEPLSAKSFDIAFCAETNVWNGRTSTCLKLRDIRLAAQGCL
ncbi:MAG: single-stranded-DNA-specific exonuclease RecJ [Proteobacteria bacterium]|nr:single-stranded-DNA-specific exonuclease RecJ [Cystobacterineae bacterium]MCL2258436.1 single-stranded-DNA-specific exonuclease RecJ [Cystobacterineae bacterium]MCL2315229.1 single-stranded-DNA-specific exonuclease RecJ [Pseudomonadota bacterium]